MFRAPAEESGLHSQHSMQTIRAPGANEKPSAGIPELHAQAAPQARGSGRPPGRRGAAPATAGRSARGTATRMPCRHVPAARRRAGHPTPAILAPGRRAARAPRSHGNPPTQAPSGQQAGTQGLRCLVAHTGQSPAAGTRAPGRAPGSMCRMRSRNGHRADPVRGKPTVTPTAQPARTPSAIRPWTPRRIDASTHSDT